MTEPHPPTEAASSTPKLSAVEGIKAASRQLRGTIADELARDSDHFSEQDKQLIKFHGSYQQEDRDARKNRRKDGVGKYYMFMVRCKMPGGKLIARQYLALDDLAGAHGNSTLRFTSRQGIQFHGVLKSHLRDVIAGINACLLSTLGACGDVNRNVMACPAPHRHDSVRDQLQHTADVLAAHLAPRTRAYHEVWLNGQPISTTEVSPHDLEPLYGKVYLPRKFKVGLALPQDNCIDVHAQDLGLLAVVEQGRIVGYNVLVGGGMGMTHGNANTFPHLARPIIYVPADAVVSAAEAVVRLFRDHGNRADRKRARIKYLVHDWGVEKFRDVLSSYLTGRPELPRPVHVTGIDLHLGWHGQGDGLWFYGLSVECGRVKDEGPRRLRSGLRALVERFQCSLRVTPHQDVLLCDLPASAQADVERTLREFGIRPSEETSPVRRLALACPAIPTCGLAISESERTLPAILDEIEAELARHGLAKEAVGIRMTGCPNGCVRPYQSDVGIVGRSGDKYALFVGGHPNGHRLNFLLKDLVARADLAPTLAPLFARFKADRRGLETFGDFCHRLGVEVLLTLLPAAPAAAAPHHSAPAPAKDKPAAAPAASASPAAPPANGAASAAPPALPKEPARVTPNGNGAALPEGRRVQETVLAGPPGAERPDHAHRYNSDGTVRETLVWFYGHDLRAGAADATVPLRRESTYLGAVDPHHLHDGRKLADTYYVGPPGHERRDYRVEYLADGQVAQTVVFHYDNDARATDAASGAAVRRQVAYEGRKP